MYVQITLLGRLGRNPELRFLPDGTAVCDFDLACDVGFGERRRVQWFKVSAFGASGEAVNQYCVKGDAVLVYSDDLTISPYLGKQDRQPKAAVQITARRVVFTGRQDTDGERIGGDVADIPF